MTRGDDQSVRTRTPFSTTPVTEQSAVGIAQPRQRTNDDALSVESSQRPAMRTRSETPWWERNQNQNEAKNVSKEQRRREGTAVATPADRRNVDESRPVQVERRRRYEQPARQGGNSSPQSPEARPRERERRQPESVSTPSRQPSYSPPPAQSGGRTRSGGNDGGSGGRKREER